MAVQMRRGSIVKTLLSAGANASTSHTNGDTPLHYAIWSGSDEIVGNLLDAGADMNAVNCRQNTVVVCSRL